jgi:hypothetical protein
VIKEFMKQIRAGITSPISKEDLEKSRDKVFSRNFSDAVDWAITKKALRKFPNGGEEAYDEACKMRLEYSEKLLTILDEYIYVR